MIRHSQTLTEKASWEAYFAQALQGQGQEHKNQAWWSIADRDANCLVQKLFGPHRPIRVLEAGCGSGGTSFSLSHFIPIEKLCLVDISPNALSFAKSLENKNLKGKTEYVESDIFHLNLGQTFDLVWNIGVIEHYEIHAIQAMVQQLYRSVSAGGYLVLGMPNRKSVAVLKAALLGSKWGKWLRWVPGYRNSTEILYSDKEMARAISESLGTPVKIEHVGSSLWVGAFSFLVKIFDRLMKPNHFSFLTFFIVKK